MILFPVGGGEGGAKISKSGTQTPCPRPRARPLEQMRPTLMIALSAFNRPAAGSRLGIVRA